MVVGEVFLIHARNGVVCDGITDTINYAPQ
jgi:hypothetical protein